MPGDINITSEGHVHMYKKGKKLDSRSVILACAAITVLCIAVNVACALVPGMTTRDDSAIEESFGDESDQGSSEGVIEREVDIDPSIVEAPGDLPEGATADGYRDAVASYLKTLSADHGAPKKAELVSSGVKEGAGPNGSDLPRWRMRAYFEGGDEAPVAVEWTSETGFSVGAR